MTLNIGFMLNKIIDQAEKNGIYDAYSDLELEYQDLVSKIENFTKKIEKLYSEKIE